MAPSPKLSSWRVWVRGSACMRCWKALPQTRKGKRSSVATAAWWGDQSL